MTQGGGAEQSNLPLTQRRGAVFKHALCPFDDGRHNFASQLTVPLWTLYMRRHPVSETLPARLPRRIATFSTASRSRMGPVGTLHIFAHRDKARRAPKKTVINTLSCAVRSDLTRHDRKTARESPIVGKDKGGTDGCFRGPPKAAGNTLRAPSCSKETDVRKI